MNLGEIQEKYEECKSDLDEHRFINWLGGNYKILKRYYHQERRRFYLRKDLEIKN